MVTAATGVVTVLPAVNNGDYTVTVESPCLVSDLLNRSFAVWNSVIYLIIAHTCQPTNHPFAIEKFSIILQFQLIIKLKGHCTPKSSK